MIKLLSWFKAGCRASRSQFGLLLAISIAAALTIYVSKMPDKQGGDVRTPVSQTRTLQASKLPKLVVTFRDVPPDMIVYSLGRHSGPLRYVLEEATARIGYAIEWKALSFSRSLAGLVDGSVDIVPSAHHKTPEREKEAHFSVSLGQQLRPVFFALHRDNPAIIKTLGDLAGHTVGHLKGSFYFAEFNSATHFKKIAYADNRSLMLGFLKGTVDIIVMNNRKAAERELSPLGYNKFKYADLIINDTPDMFFLYSRISHPQEVFDRLDQALVQMKNEGLIADIYQGFDADPPK